VAGVQLNGSVKLSPEGWRNDARRPLYGTDDVMVGGVKGEAPRNWVTGKFDPDTPIISTQINCVQ